MQHSPAEPIGMQLRVRGTGATGTGSIHAVCMDALGHALRPACGFWMIVLAVLLPVLFYFKQENYMTILPLRLAIRTALNQRCLTAAAALPALLAVSQFADAQTADTTEQKNQSLETIVVTGSNIRRVDIETANPVLTIDHAQIQASGKITLGDLVQALPSMA